MKTETVSSPKSEHFKTYEALAQSIGVDKLLKALPEAATFERVRAALASGDEHLNTIPLHLWDRVTNGLVTFRKTFPPAEVFRNLRLSISDRTCVLKHVARYHLKSPVIAPEPEPEPVVFVPQALIDYQAQAQSFLDQFGIKFRATLSDSKPCPWKDDDKIASGSGHHFRVTLSGCAPGNCEKRTRITFDFWGSLHDAQAGIKTVTPYDVLACIGSDASCPDSFEDFCSEYGYEQDSIKALQTFRRCSAFGKRLRAFFTTQELEALQQIQ